MRVWMRFQVLLCVGVTFSGSAPAWPQPGEAKFIAQVPALRQQLRHQIDAPAQFVPGTGLTPA